MSNSEVTIAFKPMDKQREVFACPARELLIGGGLGGSKSTTIVWKLFLHCKKYPGVLNGLFRKKGTHLATSTLKIWQKEIPRELYSINQKTSTITVFTGEKHNSEILFGGLDSSEDTDKFSSTDFGLVCIDQAEEITQENYEALARRLRCKLPDGTYPHFQILTSCNPRNCYLRDRFILNPSPSRIFIQMLSKDNPNLAPGYLDGVKELYQYRPEMLKALIDGSWDVLEGDSVLIRYSYAEKAARVQDPMIFTDKKIVSCDPARFGNCETVIYGWVGTKIIKQEIFGQKDEDYTASKCLAMCNEIGANTIAVDEGGPGQGVVTILNKLVKGTQIQIMPVNSARRADASSRFLNVRAEMWWEAIELFANGRVSLPDDRTLLGQLAKPTYSFNLGRIQVDDKEDIKPSPDRADACIIGLYALRRAIPLPVTIKLGEIANTEAMLDRYDYNRAEKREVGSYQQNEE